MHTRAILTFLTVLVLGQPAQSQNATAALQNAAQTSLGATAIGTGAPFNKDWPAINAIGAEGGGARGTLFGTPMVGGRVDIRLVMPVDIRAIEVVPLDYRGTLQPKACDIYVEGQKVQQADLPLAPAKPFRIPLEAKGQNVGVVVTATYPQQDLGGGKLGANYGGWARIRVLTSTDVVGAMAPVDSYQVAFNAANIAPTGGSVAEGVTAVVGQPRISKGHPCTLWDQEDVDHYKAMLATSEALRQQLAGLRRGLDKRITQPLGIPQPRQNEQGEWVHISDRETGAAHNALAVDIANLGAAYVLTGEAKYAEFAKQLLLAYAEAYPRYGVGARPGFNHDPSRVFDQRLGDAIWLIQVARGYDLIYNLPSITEEERQRIENDLVKAAGAFIVANSHHLRGATNWSAIGTCAALVAGVATDDEELINRALFGINSDKSPSKWWEGTPNRAPSGVELHFSEKSIDADGMWAEGAMGYQFMALQALVTDAEVLWHRGIDLYRYRDAALKRLFDSPLQFSYPDLKTPAIHDSGHGSIVGREAYLYEFAYRRYQDPKYLPVIRQAGQHLAAQYQQWPVSVLYDLDLNAAGTPTEWRSVNFFGVGYGILRLTDGAGTRSLLLDFGPNRSHGHPDKLNLDLWAFGDRLIPDPGSAWYEQAIYRRWYHTTMAHNTLCVDEREQQAADGEQLVYGPAETLALQRARCDTAYSGVMMDRALFLTPDYMADLFGAFARRPRVLDLCWHIRGDFASDLAFVPAPFPEPVENGYNELGDPRRVVTDQPYSARFTLAGRPAVLHAAGGTPTTVIAGEGVLGQERPTAILQRRETNVAVYGNVVDLSGNNAVTGAVLDGGLEQGYGLLTVTTAKGKDLCFASYRDGVHTVGDFSTDAQQATVRRAQDKIQALYLGGGTTVAVPGAALARQPAGLAYVERVENGAFLVGNPTATDAEVTVTMSELMELDAYTLDPKGVRTGPCPVTVRKNVHVLRMAPASRVEFAPKGAPSVHDFRQAVLRQRQQEEEAVRAKAQAEALARAQTREAAAKASPAPAQTIVAVQAEAFTAQGGGEVRIADNKKGAAGTSLSGWNGSGHWLEWTFEVPAAGYYHVAFLYCTDAATERELLVNGELQEPMAQARIELPATGGFSNGSDDWRLFVLPDPGAEHPLLLRLAAGKNVLRMANNVGGAANMDYLAVFSPDVQPTRALLAEKLPPAPPAPAPAPAPAP